MGRRGFIRISISLVMAYMNMAYSHFEHRHKFAAWCAARAVQRKFAKTIVLKAALERCGVVEFIKRNLGTPYLIIGIPNIV